MIEIAPPPPPLPRLPLGGVLLVVVLVVVVELGPSRWWKQKTAAIFCGSQG